MLIPRRHLDGIAAGEVTLAFRRWERARVKAGTRLRTAIGVVAIDDVRVVDSVSADEARRAGLRTVDEIPGTGLLHRIELRLDGPDPRIALRAAPPTEDVFRRLERMGPWTYDTLRAIAARPGVRAAELAASCGRETQPFKRDVRKLKELGLTESLEVGYRLSPRGEAVLRTHEGPADRRAPVTPPRGQHVR